MNLVSSPIEAAIFMLAFIVIVGIIVLVAEKGN